uniref:SWIRM domain-containing protein n=1 Tax=Oryza rufipogon TaxID=4529 RepID=A0A0E0REH8_ORYRU
MDWKDDADARAKWRKRKRNANTSAADHSDDSDSAAAAAANDDNDDDDAALHAATAAANGGGGTLGGGDDDPVVDLREAEVHPTAIERVSAFPPAFRRVVNRLHPSVLAVMAAERAAAAAGAGAGGGGAAVPALENISHGQLQVLSSVLPDHPSLSNDPDKPSSYVCTPPLLMECRGVAKQFDGKLLMVPKHSDWFSPMTVHRLERQVLPQFFSGKSPGHTPEKYIMLRNRVITTYLERPARRLAFSECQGLVTSTPELYDLSRIVRFLDAWGIINYLAAGSVQRGLRMAATLIREEPTGELHLMSAPLKSIDGLILFDRPKCSVRAEDIASGASLSSSPGMENGDAGFDEKTLLERLSESFCSFCAQPLPSLHYESQKEADIALCSDCFHDARFVTGHSSLDFQRVDGKKDGLDNDGDSWTDQETFLLLEGIDKYKENWNAVAEHVGTKSKIQCLHHFLRLPVEDGLLENIKVPEASFSSKFWLMQNASGSVFKLPQLFALGSLPQSGEAGDLPFINTANPVMSLISIMSLALLFRDDLQIAFLASSLGPRVAASCASEALIVLTGGDSRISSIGNDVMGHAARPNCDSSLAVSSENVRHAARCGLSAAATKCKLFADQEEREIQRLSATIINHQLKRLELKLKQFADIETYLLRDSEQSERMRQGLQAQRIRMMSGLRLASPRGNTMASNPLSQANIRPPGIPGSMPQAGTPAFYSNNMQDFCLEKHNSERAWWNFERRASLDLAPSDEAPMLLDTAAEGNLLTFACADRGSELKLGEIVLDSNHASTSRHRSDVKHEDFTLEGSGFISRDCGSPL